MAYLTSGQHAGGCAGAMSYYTASGEPPGQWAGKGAAALGAIKAPTLVLAGAEDLAAPPWQGARTALGIADSRLTVICGTSHLAPYQTPGPVTAAILSHLVG